MTETYELIPKKTCAAPRTVMSVTDSAVRSGNPKTERTTVYLPAVATKGFHFSSGDSGVMRLTPINAITEAPAAGIIM